MIKLIFYIIMAAPRKCAKCAPAQGLTLGFFKIWSILVVLKPAQGNAGCLLSPSLHLHWCPALSSDWSDVDCKLVQQCVQ